MRYLGLLLFSLASFLSMANPLLADDDPLPRAHAHNDYLHDRPLLDALDQGFCSVEADIFLVNNELLVAHTRLELDPAKTLRTLYLEPLRQRVSENEGRVYKGHDQQLTLLIDLKSDGAATYKALDALLSEYSDLFSVVDASGTANDPASTNQVPDSPVLAIISGDRPIELVAADATRYVGIDGRLSDLDSTSSPSLLPLISDNWNQHFAWRGRGEMPDEDREKLQAIVKQVHDSGRRIRFWAVPDHEASWRMLDEAGVDFINTDKLDELAAYLRSR